MTRALAAGQFRPLRDGMRELKIDDGPGYRVCHTCRGKTLIRLLCGANQSTQSQDIKLASDTPTCSKK